MSLDQHRREVDRIDREISDLAAKDFALRDKARHPRERS